MLESYSDANHPDESSQGILISLKDEKGQHYLICWQTRKIQPSIKSMLSAGTMVLFECAETTIHNLTFIYHLQVSHPSTRNNDCMRDKKDTLYLSKCVEDTRLKIHLIVL